MEHTVLFEALHSAVAAEHGSKATSRTTLDFKYEHSHGVLGLVTLRQHHNREVTRLRAATTPLG
jgi:hypothetical protein